MKQNTAMQELIDWVNSKTQLFMPTKSQIIEKATELLKKEEEQIMLAYFEGVDKTINDDAVSPQEYFNQTYQ